MDKKVILVFGGSFNPPLNSHFSFAEQAADEYKCIEKVLFLPVNNQYNKPDLIEGEHRYNMLKLVTDKNDKFDVYKIEIENKRASIETLEILRNQYEDKEIWFACGTDNLERMHTWVNAEELVSDYKILAFEREEDNLEEIISNNPFLTKHRQSFLGMKEMMKNNFSSTAMRQKIAEGKSIRYLVPDEVYEYIKENRLYEK